MTGGGELLSLLRRRIRKEGRITFAAFMAEALYHPTLGRYSAVVPPMGTEGDYLTSPEVDPAFGRLLGRAVAEMAERTARERRGGAAGLDPFTVVEAGPGRGTLCRDLLAALSEDAPDLARRLRYVLVESSEALRREQRSVLAEAGLLHRVEWVAWDDLLARGPIVGCILANEFLDALPVHLVEWSGGQLYEIYVTADDEGRLREAAGPPSSAAVARHLEGLEVTLEEGQRAEINLAALRWIAQAASLLEAGYAVVIDYGHEAAELFSERHYAGTLVGYRRHQLVVDPLSRPGEQDLTSHVDFTSVTREALRRGFDAWALTSQRRLLVAMGLAEMIADLSSPRAGADPAERTRRRFALHALMSPSGMGETFKVLVLARRTPLEGLRCLRDPFRGDEAAAG